jgi:hypothetical protein
MADIVIKRTVPPEVYAIALVAEGKKVVGVQMVDVSLKLGTKGSLFDFPLGVVEKAVRTDANLIRNLAFNGSLRLINGDIRKFPVVDKAGKLLTPERVHVLNTITQDGRIVGYRIVNYKGKTVRERADKVLAAVEKFGLLNGIIQENSYTKVISGIERPIANVELSKTAVAEIKSGSRRIRAASSLAENGVARREAIDLENILEKNDAFKSLNHNQKTALQKYYMWYTVEKFNELAHGTSLEANPVKLAKLAELRGYDRWVYGGYMDCREVGKVHCELGHPLRHVHYANAVDKNGKVLRTICFGEDCSADFFSIPRENMGKLAKVRQQVSSEIDELLGIMNNRDTASEEDLHPVPLFEKLVFSQSEAEIVKFFGQKLGTSLLDYKATGLPFPQSMVELACQKMQDEGREGLNYLGNVAAGYRDTIERVYESPSYYWLMNVFKDYLKFTMQNTIEGKYRYNPSKKNDYNKKKGSFSKQAVYERRVLLFRFKEGLGATEFSFKELSGLLNIFKISISRADEIGDEFSRVCDNILNAKPSDEVKKKLVPIVLASRLTNKAYRARLMSLNLDGASRYSFGITDFKSVFDINSIENVERYTKYLAESTGAYREGLAEYKRLSGGKVVEKPSESLGVAEAKRQGLEIVSGLTRILPDLDKRIGAVVFDNPEDIKLQGIDYAAAEKEGMKITTEKIALAYATTPKGNKFYLNLIAKLKFSAGKDSESVYAVSDAMMRVNSKSGEAEPLELKSLGAIILEIHEVCGISERAREMFGAEYATDDYYKALKWLVDNLINRNRLGNASTESVKAFYSAYTKASLTDKHYEALFSGDSSSGEAGAGSKKSDEEVLKEYSKSLIKALHVKKGKTQGYSIYLTKGNPMIVAYNLDRDNRLSVFIAFHNSDGWHSNLWDKAKRCGDADLILGAMLSGAVNGKGFEEAIKLLSGKSAETLRTVVIGMVDGIKALSGGLEPVKSIYMSEEGAKIFSADGEIGNEVYKAILV